MNVHPLYEKSELDISKVITILEDHTLPSCTELLHPWIAEYQCLVFTLTRGEIIHLLGPVAPIKEHIKSFRVPKEKEHLLSVTLPMEARIQYEHFKNRWNTIIQDLPENEEEKLHSLSKNTLKDLLEVIQEAQMYFTPSTTVPITDEQVSKYLELLNNTEKTPELAIN